MSTVPTPGRIALYTLRADDVRDICIARSFLPHNSRGNDVKYGEEFPMLIIKAWGATPQSAVNGRVFLDGNDTYWARSASPNLADDSVSVPGTYRWPPRT